MIDLYIPSPPQGEWSLFGFPIRAYALAIMTGIVVAWVVGSRRWAARGGRAETLETAVLVSIPLGIIGARVYYVLTDLHLYFGPGRDPISMFYIWEGGLAIFGAVAGGAFGMWLVARRRGASFLAIADALAPGLVLAQAIGRLGNYFNQELFGVPTTLPWALQIDPENRPTGYAQFETFHPTFLYEMVWNVGVAVVLIWAGKRFALGRGKTFALYVILYGIGRFWIELLRIDPANEYAGIRTNSYATGLLLLGGVVLMLWLLRHRPGLEESVEPGADPLSPSERPDPAHLTETSEPTDADDPSDADEVATEPAEPAAPEPEPSGPDRT